MKEKISKKGGNYLLWEFIIKYWVEFAFGIIVAGIGAFLRRYMKLEKENRQKEQDDFYLKIKTEIDNGYNKSQEDDVTLQSEINDITGVLKDLTRGLLSVQGRQFKEDCKQLLLPEHRLTIDEYQQIIEDHDAYHGLGGNHNGDALFDLVQKKAEKELNIKLK